MLKILRQQWTERLISALTAAFATTASTAAFLRMAIHAEGTGECEKQDELAMKRNRLRQTAD
jgi:ATP-dependent Clp protease adapter protein ClpS